MKGSGGMNFIKIRKIMLAAVLCISAVLCGCSETAGEAAATKDITDIKLQTSEIQTSGASVSEQLSENYESQISDNNNSAADEQSGKSNNTSEAGAENNNDSISVMAENSSDTIVQNIVKNKLKRKKFNLNVPYISQYPELPTGCEVVSLTMLINRLGYSVDKEYMADECLVYGDSYVTSYSGDPYTENGSGIYPPGIVRTVQEFAKKRSADVDAVDLTGTSLEDLYKLIENGYPVMIWTTLRMEYPNYDDDFYFEEYNGIKYPWYINEHCVVMTGYDKENGTVILNDPLYGQITRDIDIFEEVYDDIGRFSLTVIRKNG